MCEQEYSAEHPSRATQSIDYLNNNFVEMLIISIGTAQNQHTITDIVNEQDEYANKPHIHKI